MSVFLMAPENVNFGRDRRSRRKINSKVPLKHEFYHEIQTTFFLQPEKNAIMSPIQDFTRKTAQNNFDNQVMFLKKQCPGGLLGHFFHAKHYTYTITDSC